MPRYVRFRRPDGTVGAGLLDGGRVRVVEEPFWERTVVTGEVLALEEVRLLPPCQPRAIVCVGLNYASHLGGRPAPNPPTLFFKPLSSIAGPDDPILLPPGAGRVDPEGEVVIVVGRTLKRVDPGEALAGIFGYTAGNDVSAREWQRLDGQWWRAKGADSFGVFGPAIATDLRHDDIEVITRIDGREVQRGNTRELILDIPSIVSYVSQVMTLVPGDIIFTGTPGEPQPIVPGQVVEVEVPGVGVLRNPVRADG